jgi:hypothetical protein
VLYVVSNVCWIRYGLATKTPGITVQNSIFLLSSVAGIWFWFIKA